MWSVVVRFIGGGKCIREYTTEKKAREAAAAFATAGLERTCPTGGFIFIPPHRVEVITIDVKAG